MRIELKQVNAWLPLLLLPMMVVGLIPESWPRWALMWLLALSLFAGCKWLTWHHCGTFIVYWQGHLSYLLAWPGLDAAAFLGDLSPVPRKLAPLECWLFAGSKILLGTMLLALYPCLHAEDELLRGWVGMVGIVFVLHFGLFHLFSLVWRWRGRDARPLMNWPVRSRSVSEFWGQRWNTAFRDLTHLYVFRPLQQRFGATTALVIGFLFSGLIHELVLSLPARAGYGGPTVYFLIQAAAILLERSTPGKRLGLVQGWRGWIFTMLVVVFPVGFLFHPPFVREVMVPFLDEFLPMAGVSCG